MTMREDSEYLKRKKSIDDLLKKGKITEELHKNMLLDLEESITEEKLKERSRIEKLFRDGKISKETYENMFLDLEEPTQIKKGNREEKKVEEKIIDSEKKKKLKLLKEYRVNPSFYEHQDIKKIDGALSVAKDIKKITEYKKEIPKSVYNTIKSESEEIYLMLTATDIPAARKRIDELIEKCVETKVKIDAYKEKHETITQELETKIKDIKKLTNVEELKKEFNNLVSRAENIFSNLEKYEFKDIVENIREIEELKSHIDSERKRFEEIVETLEICKTELSELKRGITTRIGDEALIKRYNKEHTNLNERFKKFDQTSELSEVKKLQNEIIKKNYEIKNIKTLRNKVYESDVFKKYTKLLDAYKLYGFSINYSKFDGDIKKITSEETKNELLEKIELKNKELEKKVSEAGRIYTLVVEFEGFSFEDFPEKLITDLNDRFQPIGAKLKEEKLEGLYEELKDLVDTYEEFKVNVLPRYKYLKSLETEARDAINAVQNVAKSKHFKEKISLIFEPIRTKEITESSIQRSIESLRELREEIKIYLEEEKTIDEQIKATMKETEKLMKDIKILTSEIESFDIKKEVIDQIQKKISHLEHMIKNISIKTGDIIKAQAIKADAESLKIVLEEKSSVYLDFLECQHVLKELESFGVKKEVLDFYEQKLKTIETAKEELFMPDYRVAPISQDVKELKKDLKEKKSILESKDLEVINIKSKLKEMNEAFKTITISEENFEDEIERSVKEYRDAIITMNESHIKETRKKIENLDDKIKKKLKKEIEKYLLLIEKIKEREEDISGYDAILKKSLETAEKFEFKEIEERIKIIKVPTGKKLLCPYCENKIKIGSDFCPECGEKIVWCSKCSTPNTKDSKFCIKDGYLLKPEEEIKKILDKKGTVLLGDLKGLSEESAREKLKEFYEKYKNEMTIFFENDVLRTSKEDRMVECPKCNVLFNASTGACPQCGWIFFSGDIENEIKKILEEWGSVASDFEDLEKAGCTDEHIKLFYEKYNRNAKDTLGFEIELLEDGTLIKK